MTNNSKGSDFHNGVDQKESTMNKNFNWGDFNTAADQNDDFKYDAKSLKAKLISQLPTVLPHLFPAGKFQGKKFMVGSINGEPGKSLVVELEGPKPGMWIDFATGEGGDILHAWAAVMKINHDNNFPELVESVARWLGEPENTINHANQLDAEIEALSAAKKNKNVYIDELGPPTAKWDYWDAENNLIACVYRYDTPEGKQFRPWDVKARAKKAPDPRPLYNQPQISKSDHVILVEGEKAADALISKGIVAATAMNGANAPVDKTDWSPLKDKHVLIWPDNDEPGRDYANRAAQTIANVGTSSVGIIQIPEGLPEKWDAFDAIEDEVDAHVFIRKTNKTIIKENAYSPLLQAGKVRTDQSPFSDDLIAPHILPPGSMVVFGGAPKVGKSDFMLSWLYHLAAGEPFLTFSPPRPLRIVYLQFEIQYDYLRKRLQQIKLPEAVLEKGDYNLYLTPKLRLILNDNGTKKLIGILKKLPADQDIDILAIDPIRNVFDSGPNSGGENDNDGMMFFLQERIERIRDAVNPNAGIILVHHTKKILKQHLQEEPFQAFSGASSLRSYYTTGMMMYRPDENITERRLVFELRNGPHISTMHIDKQDGQWVQLDQRNPRLIQKEYGAKHDAERIRKNDVILQLIFEEASQGRVYTANQFANAFEGKAGLGAERTIRQRIAVLATKGYVKFFRNTAEFGFAPLLRNKFGYLCVEDMRIPNSKDTNDSENNEKDDLILIKPTHYKCRHTGAALPVEDANVWIYHEEL